MKFSTLSLRFICLILGHEYVLTQRLSAQSRRIAYSRCHQMFAMNDDVKTVVPCPPEFHRMYERHGVRIEYRTWEGTPPWKT